MENLYYIVAYATLAFILFQTLKSLRSIFYVHIIAERIRCTFDLKNYGKWAVITGSTDGIGKGYAIELARRGLNVFLISRSQNKLDITAKEIRDGNNGIEVRTLAFDFSAETVHSYDIVKKALVSLEIGILVNNVGINSEWPDYFDRLPEKFLKNMIDINCSSVMEMTHIILPQMLKRRKGVIINLSSVLGLFPTPFVTVYSSTKTFVKYFTQALIGEYADKGIVFQNVTPYLVATKMQKVASIKLLVPDPNSYAKSALNTVGLESETTGCISHAVQHALMQFVPDFVTVFVFKKICIHMRQNVENEGKNG